MMEEEYNEIEEFEKDNRFIVDGKKNKHTEERFCWGKNQSRILEQKFNNDVEQHIITDYIPSLVKHEKNPFPAAVSMLHDHSERTICNKNEKTTKKATDVKEAEPKMIHLAEIENGLYLGNLESIDDIDHLEACKIKTIINLSMCKLKVDEFGVKKRCARQWAKERGFLVFNLTFKDSRAITFAQMKEFVKQICTIIEINIERGNVLVVCENGVNKSPVAIVGYAVTKNKCTFDRAVDYIDEQKLKKYDQWDNLTNLHLKNCLRALQPV